MSVLIDDGSVVEDGVRLGVNYKEGSQSPRIGENSVIRSGSIIYNDVEIGKKFRSGHNVLIREKTIIGDNVLIGSMSVIDGHCNFGSNVKVQTGVYIPMYTTIGNNVFVGPKAVLTNDKYPVRGDRELNGPVIEDGVTIGANTTILPDIRIGENAFIAAGAVVTKDVPENKLAIGVPAKILELPLEGVNEIA